MSATAARQAVPRYARTRASAATTRERVRMCALADAPERGRCEPRPGVGLAPDQELGSPQCMSNSGVSGAPSDVVPVIEIALPDVWRAERMT